MSIRDHIEDGAPKSLAPPRPGYPWQMLAANAVGIAGAHAVGYLTAGALSHALSKTRAGPLMASMSPHKQERLIGHLVGAAGSAGTVAASIATLAGQARVADELSRLESERAHLGMQKAAHIMEVYRTALEEYPR